jgi:hypothetical protein
MKQLALLAWSSFVLFAVAPAGVKAGGDDIPEGLQGFSGHVRGVVVSKGEDDTLKFKVGRVLNVWENNKSKSPESIAGRTVSVGPAYVKGEDMKWRPAEAHVAFIKKLKAGQEMSLEIRNVDGTNNFQILELSDEQRGVGRREGDRREGDRREGDRREGDRREGDRREGDRRDRDRREGDREEDR